MSCSDLPNFSVDYLRLWLEGSQTWRLTRLPSCRCVRISQFRGSGSAYLYSRYPRFEQQGYLFAWSSILYSTSTSQPFIRPWWQPLTFSPLPYSTAYKQTCDRHHCQSLSCWIFRMHVQAHGIGYQSEALCLSLPWAGRSAQAICSTLRRRPDAN